jgi:hypothetical protein
MFLLSPRLGCVMGLDGGFLVDGVDVVVLGSFVSRSTIFCPSARVRFYGQIYSTCRLCVLEELSRQKYGRNTTWNMCIERKTDTRLSAISVRHRKPCDRLPR